MNASRLAWTALLVGFAFLAAASAQRYAPAKWEECADPKLSEAFKKLTGEEPSKVQWVTGTYGTNAAGPPTIHVNSAWVLGTPKDAGDRIQEGIVEYFYLGAVGDPKKGFWPGDPSEWWSVRGTPGNYATRYVVAVPPDGVAKEDRPLAERLYNRPIFADPEMPAAECLELIDATFRLGISARDAQEMIPGWEMWDEKKKPDFGELACLLAHGTYFEIPDKPAADRRLVGLSQGGDGATLLFFRRKDGAFQLEQVGGVDF